MRVPRREWHEKNTDAENDGRNELKSKRKTPCSFALCRASAADVVGAVVDPEGDHDTERDGELLESDETTSHFWWCELGAEKLLVGGTRGRDGRAYL